MQKCANLVDFEKKLKNAPILAIVAVDTAENGPSKIWQNLPKSDDFADRYLPAQNHVAALHVVELSLDQRWGSDVKL